MSYCCTLLKANSSDPACGEWASEKEYCGFKIPPEWIAMFRAENIRAKDPTEEDEEEYFCMVATCESAATTLQQRIPSIESLFSSEHLASSKSLLEELKSSNEKYVQLDLGPILAPSAESMKDELPFWQETLSGLDKPIGKIRTGLSRFICGSGIPKAWKNVKIYTP